MGNHRRRHPLRKNGFLHRRSGRRAQWSGNGAARGWRVLSKIDGMRSVQEIAEILRIPYAYTAKVIFNLHKSNLVEIVPPSSKPAADIVPATLLDRITAILTEVIGPMAGLVLRDQIKSLGESLDSFPEAKLDELVTLVAREISDGK